ncbi:MAG: CHAT domain-containing protein [Candidatus Eremiobacteraeota bacterium]|nr:CHAT domain-containing protein [Candidatus Eremiobacteraeota bacterium]MCW5871639.1 CHAT domain-containing protein [Candidatus Eremiobacteraeota bacterium]
MICRFKAIKLCRAGLSLWISLLCLALPGQAKPTLEQLRGYIAKLELRQQAGDIRGILQQAGEQPELAAILLHDWPLEGLTEPRSQLLTLLKRGLELKDTPLALQSAPTVDLSTRLEAIDWLYWGAPNAARLLDLGNFRQLAVLLDAYRAHLEEAERGDVARARLWQAEARLLSGDFPYSAARRQQLVEWAKKSPDDLAFLYACLAVVATDSGRSDLATQLLNPLEEALEHTAPERRALYGFVLETLRYRLAARSRAEVDLADLRLRHDRAWKSLAGYQGNRSADMRLWMRCAQYWSGVLDNEINYGRAEFKETQLADSQQMFKVAEEALNQDSYGAQLGCLSGVLDLELTNQWLGTRSLEQSRPLLELTGKTLDTYRGWLEADQQQQNETCPPLLRRRLGTDFQLELVHGDLDTLGSRYLALRQLHSPSSSNLQELLNAGDSSTRYHGLAGFRDARYLLLLNPATQGEEAERLIGSLQQEWERCQYRPGLIALPMERGRRLAQRGLKEEAVAQLSQGTGPLEKYLAELGAGLQMVQAYRHDYMLLARLQADLGQPAQAFATVARFNNLEAVQRGTKALWQRPEVARVRQLSEEGQSLEQQAAVRRSLGKAPDSQLLAQNREQFQQKLNQLLQREPRYRLALSVQPADLTSAQKHLPADTVLVQYLPGPEGLYVFVVTRQAIKVRRVDVAQADLEKTVARWRGRIASFPTRVDLLKHFSWTDRSAPGYDSHTRPLLEDGRRLYDWLLRPLEADLRGHSVVAIVPSGNLYYLPFAGLIRGMGPKGPKFVAQRWQCVELVKAADLRELQTRGAQARGLLALANPDGSLPGAEREVRQIARFFPRPRLHFGKAARPELLRPMPAGIGYLHLATHGVLNGLDPVASYLVVAGSRLHIRDVYGLSLKNTRLVTLSACQTAMQEGAVTGGEVTSLAQAFSVAGGQAVLASLWNVSDDGTERLMSAFYPKLARGLSLSKALQQAQLEVLAQRQFQHPFYWAAFSLYGDWR